MVNKRELHSSLPVGLSVCGWDIHPVLLPSGCSWHAYPNVKLNCNMFPPLIHFLPNRRTASLIFHDSYHDFRFSGWLDKPIHFISDLGVLIKGGRKVNICCAASLDANAMVFTVLNILCIKGSPQTNGRIRGIRLKIAVHYL